MAELSQEGFQEAEAIALFCYMLSLCPLPHENDLLFGKEEEVGGVWKNPY